MLGKSSTIELYHDLLLSLSLLLLLFIIVFFLDMLSAKLRVDQAGPELSLPVSTLQIAVFLTYLIELTALNALNDPCSLITTNRICLTVG